MVKKIVMKKRITLFLLCILLIVGVATSTGRKYIGRVASLSQSSLSKIFQDDEEVLSTKKLQKNYQSLRDSIEIKRNVLAKEYNSKNTAQGKKLVLNKARVYLRDVLTEKVYPTWYGTTWDFNGITETPGNGTIACGYFVSTTIRHTGINVNRYKLAQKYSHAIVKSLCNDVKVYSDFENVMSYLKTRPDDLYVVGLDNHVGMISKKGKEINFIHSSFVYPSHVISEDATTSSVLGGSDVYVIGNMTSNPLLLKAWLLGTKITILD
jgi:hypothetical protein